MNRHLTLDQLATVKPIWFQDRNTTTGMVVKELNSRIREAGMTFIMEFVPFMDDHTPYTGFTWVNVTVIRTEDKHYGVHIYLHGNDHSIPVKWVAFCASETWIQAQEIALYVNRLLNA